MTVFLWWLMDLSTACLFPVNGLPIPVLDNDGITFELFFLRRTDLATSGLTYTPQFSVDLGSFTPSSDTPTRVFPDPEVDSAYEVVKVPYPTGTRFGRIEVTETP